MYNLSQKRRLDAPRERDAQGPGAKRQAFDFEIWMVWLDPIIISRPSNSLRNLCLIGCYGLPKEDFCTKRLQLSRKRESPL